MCAVFTLNSRHRETPSLVFLKFNQRHNTKKQSDEDKRKPQFTSTKSSRSQKQMFRSTRIFKQLCTVSAKKKTPIHKKANAHKNCSRDVLMTCFWSSDVFTNCKSAKKKRWPFRVGPWTEIQVFDHFRFQSMLQTSVRVWKKPMSRHFIPPTAKNGTPLINIANPTPGAKISSAAFPKNWERSWHSEPNLDLNDCFVTAQFICQSRNWPERVQIYHSSTFARTVHLREFWQGKAAVVSDKLESLCCGMISSSICLQLARSGLAMYRIWIRAFSNLKLRHAAA